MANEAHQLMRVRNWLAILLFVIVTLLIFAIGRSGPQNESRPVIRGHVKHLRKKLSELISENAKLREETMFLSSEARASVIQNANDLPTVQHERLVRKVGIDVRELGYYVTSRLEMSAANLAQLPRDINRTTTSTIDGLQQTLRQIKAYIRTTMVDLKSLSDPDSDWRQKESEHLSKMVQHRIHRIMNPADCNKKKKFICDLRVYCGFGCEFHHLLTCMVIAVYHRRPLILLPTAGKLSGSVWERVFRPISDSCGNMSYDKFVKWEGDKTDHDAIIVPSANHFQEGQRYPPLAIPEELAPRLTRLHGNPAVWWIGQLAKYLWKFQPQTSQYVDEVANRTGFKSPIVGIHVRRTDKLVREASSHAIQEYMTWVDEYYNEREMTEKIDKRRVFIATDEPNVILKARSL